MRCFVLFLLLLIPFSCNQPSNIEKAAVPQETKAQGTVMPQESLKPPQVISLATMPPPLTVEVPTQAGGFYTTKINNQETRIDLLPPETKPAGVFYTMQNYTSSDGLALDEIFSGMIDKKGNLWFGSNGGGVSKYDGKSFTNYTQAEGLSNDNVWCILEDKAGNLWFGGLGGGVSKYDGKSFTNYTQAEGLAANDVQAILEDKTGNLWFGTDQGGVSKYDGKSFTTYTTAEGLANDNVLSILEDKTGNLWFGTQEGVSKYDGKSFTTYTTAEGLAANGVQAILEDKTGNLWFGTQEGGVSKYDGKSFTTYTTKQGLVSNTIWSILEDKIGNLWFGTEGGASEYDGKSFITFSVAQGLTANSVRVILEDETGNLWFGTHGGGVSEYGGKAFTNYTTAHGLPNIIVRSILEDKTGNLWISTQGGGVSKYDGKSFATYTREQGLADNNLRCSLEDKNGNLWFGSYGGGVSKYDGKSFTTYTKEQGLPDNFIRYIFEDKTGNLWFGTDKGGVSKYDGKSFTLYSTEQGLANNAIWNILEDKTGNLWFGTFGGGVSKYDGKSFTTYTTAQGLVSNYIMSSLEDEMGNLWFGTGGGGVSRYDGKSFITYTAAQGLPDNVAYQTIITKEQNIAFGTNDGIAILTGYSSLSPRGKEGKGHIPSQNNLTNEELKNYKPVFEIYNSKRGYPIKDGNGGENSMFLDSQGILWIGTGSAKTGLVRFDYSMLNKNNNPLNVFIQSVKIDNENISWYDLLNKESGTKSSKTKNGGTTIPPNLTEEGLTFGRPLSDEEKGALHSKFGDIKFDGITRFYYVPENLVLPHKLNNITFDFAALELVRPQDVLYQYKLEGYDKDWSSPSNNTRATYGNIFEGTYPFKVKAQSPFGVWSEPLIYTFKVLPPWYRTWWAYLLYGTSSTTALVLIFRWRTATLRRKLEHEEFLYHAAERFVPKRFLELLHREHLEDVQLGDSAALPVTILFTDIRNFTTFAESHTPEQTALFLNAYTHYMVPIVQENKGFVGQFLGDGILAVFPETPSDAVNAAIAMAKILPSFNKEISEKNFPPIRIGIGINSGDSLLIARGEEERLEASVVSDAINTASRVQDLNKYYKTELLITDVVYQQLDPEKYLIRLIDKVILKGKTAGTGLFEVKPLPEGEALQNERLYYALYAEAFAFYEKGDFTKAEAAFKLCLEKKPDDTVAKLQMERCIEFQKSGVPPGWDGTYTLKEK